MGFLKSIFGGGSTQSRQQPAEKGVILSFDAARTVSTVDLEAWKVRQRQGVVRVLKKLFLTKESSLSFTHEFTRSKGNTSDSSEILRFLDKGGYFEIDNAVNTGDGVNILGPTSDGGSRAVIPLRRKADGTYDEIHVYQLGTDQYRWVVTEGRFSGRGLDAQ